MMPVSPSLPRQFRAFAAFICLCLVLGGCGYSDEMHERQTWRKLLWYEKYGELDQLIDQAYVERQKGKLSSNRLRGRFWQLQQTDASFAPRFDAWVARQNSAHAYLARGWFRLQQASNIRGDGPASDVSAQNMASMRTLLTEAKADLAQSLLKDPLCAMCVGGEIYANTLLGKRDPGLIDQALSLDPNLWQPLAEHLVSLSTQWGGSDEAMERFISDMEARGYSKTILDRLNALRLFQQGLILQYDDHDVARAIEKYELAVSYAPNPNALQNLAELYAEQGRFEKASAALERNLRENDPWDLYSIEALAQTYFAQGRESDGKKMLDKRNELISRYSNGE